MQSVERWVGWAAAIALGLLLVTTNVRFAANSLWLYEQLFERNRVPERTGLTMAELSKVGETIQDYFASDEEPLHVEATINGETIDLFNEEEVAHMADVKALFLRTYRVQWLSAGVLFAAIGFVAYRRRSGAVPVVALWLMRGSVIIGAAIVAIGLASVVAFRQVFLLFHYIGFPQGNFTFDPNTTWLVRVFPTGFWSDMTFVIGGLTLVQAAVLFVSARLAKRRALAEVSDE